MDNKGFLPYVFIVLISILLTGGFNYFRDKELPNLVGIDRNIQSDQAFVNLAANNMRIYIWNYDPNGAKELCNLLLKYPEIKWVLVTDRHDKTFAESNSKNIDKNKLIFISAPVKSSNQRIGELRLGFEASKKERSPFDLITIIFFETSVLVLSFIMAIIVSIKSKDIY